MLEQCEKISARIKRNKSLQAWSLLLSNVLSPLSLQSVTTWPQPYWFISGHLAHLVAPLQQWNLDLTAWEAIVGIVGYLWLSLVMGLSCVAKPFLFDWNRGIKSVKSVQFCCKWFCCWKIKTFEPQYLISALQLESTTHGVIRKVAVSVCVWVGRRRFVSIAKHHVSDRLMILHYLWTHAVITAGNKCSAPPQRDGNRCEMHSLTEILGVRLSSLLLM